jgi:hypothetical protein|tara:strand:- start:14815 stop:15264 length:450 start_codon:yes stop_codon:yes gene_type:complete
MLTDSLKPTGQLKIVLRDKDGNVKSEKIEKNLVVTTGLNYIAARMTDGSIPTDMSHMAVGTGTTSAAAGQTALVTESARVALTGGQGAPSTNTIVYTATFAAGTGTGALTEAGVLNASSSGTMLCRTVFSAVNKGADDSVTITWTITIS